MAFSGNYKAIIKKRTVSKSPNGATQFCIKAELTKKLVNDKYVDIQKETGVDYSLWGDLTLLNCDGTINHVQLNSLKSSINWNGASLKELSEIDILEKEFPVLISIWNGKSKIDFINSECTPKQVDLDSLDSDWKKRLAENVKDFG